MADPEASLAALEREAENLDLAIVTMYSCLSAGRELPENEAAMLPLRLEGCEAALAQLRAEAKHAAAVAAGPYGVPDEVDALFGRRERLGEHLTSLRSRAEPFFPVVPAAASKAEVAEVLSDADSDIDIVHFQNEQPPQQQQQQQVEEKEPEEAVPPPPQPAAPLRADVSALSEEDLARASAASPSSGAGSARDLSLSAYGDECRQLEKMGFRDHELNEHLLGNTGGNMNQVVSWLVKNSALFTDERRPR